MTNQVSLEFLVETIAKALCFERYVAEAQIADPEEIDLSDVVNFYDKHKDVYLNKAYELLVMVKGSEEFINNTLH
jgi:hypothetical protein